MACSAIPVISNIVKQGGSTLDSMHNLLQFLNIIETMATLTASVLELLPDGDKSVVWRPHEN